MKKGIFLLVILSCSCQNADWDSRFNQISSPLNVLGRTVVDNYSCLYSRYRVSPYYDTGILAFQYGIHKDAKDSCRLDSLIEANMKQALIQGLTARKERIVLLSYKHESGFMNGTIYYWCYSPFCVPSDSLLSMHIDKITALKEPHWYHIVSTHYSE